MDDDALRLAVEVEGNDAILTLERSVRGEWVIIGCAAMQTYGAMEAGCSWAETAVEDALSAARHTIRLLGFAAVGAAEAAARQAWVEAHVF